MSEHVARIVAACSFCNRARELKDRPIHDTVQAAVTVAETEMLLSEVAAKAGLLMSGATATAATIVKHREIRTVFSRS
jgi:hypothetical protein